MLQVQSPNATTHQSQGIYVQTRINLTNESSFAAVLRSWGPGGDASKSGGDASDRRATRAVAVAAAAAAARAGEGEGAAVADADARGAAGVEMGAEEAAMDGGAAGTGGAKSGWHRL
ncbi:unnamed protein product [Effrenium voratum]|nr:unnamed protein product [Effrenium voratum]